MKSTVYFILLLPFFIFSQSEIKGMVMELDPQNQHIPSLQMMGLLPCHISPLTKS
jgi:hypothetical protein